MTFYLGRRSISRLEGVHPDLVRVVRRAIKLTSIDFTVLEGLRNMERQKKLLDIGASKTLRSRHLTGHAVDLGVYAGGRVMWDWPLYYKLADSVKEAARLEDVGVEWGGDWVTFKDGPHWQLPWKTYSEK